MKKFAAVLPGLCLALVAFTARADTLKYDGPNPPDSIGPYNMTLNPGTAGSMNLALFCMNDNLEITVGESWPVNVILGSSLGGDFSSTVATEYEDEAYILSELGKSNGMGGTYSDTNVQEALWKVFDSTATTDAGAAALYAAATGAAGGSFITAGGYDNYIFYIYSGPCEGANCSGDPQNFIGDPNSSVVPPAPEPSALLLLGTGLTGLAGLTRRRMVRR